MIVVSTDGSALGNPNGPMGWAWADHHDQVGEASEHQHSGDADAGGATNGTNQIGELCAVLEALRAHPGSEDLIIETDSQYAINCATTWIHGWKKNGWKNSKKEPVKNAQLIRAIDAEITKRAGSVRFQWVKGHAGNPGNEKVDMLARTYAEDCRSKTKNGYLPQEGWQSLLASDYSEGTDVPADAQLLLDDKLTAEEYHVSRAVGDDTNPAFRAIADTKSKSTQAPTPDQKPAHDTSKNTVPTQHAEPSAVQTNNATQDASHETACETLKTQPNYHYQLVPGLSVAGTLQFTPAPQQSPSYDGKPRYIQGKINVEGYVNPDGTLSLNATNFYVATPSESRQ